MKEQEPPFTRKRGSPRTNGTKDHCFCESCPNLKSKKMSAIFNVITSREYSQCLKEVSQWALGNKGKNTWGLTKYKVHTLLVRWDFLRFSSPALSDWGPWTSSLNEALADGIKTGSHNLGLINRHQELMHGENCNSSPTIVLLNNRPPLNSTSGSRSLKYSYFGDTL